MTAGRGIAHSEESIGAQGTVHAAQLWIALPDAQRHGAPAFVHHPHLPQAGLGGFRVTVLAGRALGLSSPIELFSPLLGLDLTCPGAAQADVELRADFEHALLCLRGAARIDGEPLAPGTLLYAPTGRERVRIESNGAAQLLLIGGTPFPEPLLVWWNFVARTQVEIEQAGADWNAGRRFAPVAGTALPRVPAPELAGVRLKVRTNAPDSTPR
jgi:redox-sensitive bicupin YhaK (pirin superfamily)